MSGSPTTRSLSLLRERGYEVDISEKYNHHSRTHKDLFGFADIMGVKQGVTLAVQTTTSGNMSARIKKLAGNPLVDVCKAAGWKIEVHGWALKGPAGKRKTWKVRIVEI
jgi:carbonic anhydrase